MRATDSDCIMSHGATQRCPQAFKAKVMQITALLLLSLLAVSNAQPTPEAEPETTSSESSNGLVSYILTHSQSLSCEALHTKCKDLNCTAVICGVVKQLVVMQDPEGVSALSVDPALSTANQNVQVSLDYVTRDVITAANASLETNPPWHLDRINQAALPLDGYYATTYTGVGVNVYMIPEYRAITASSLMQTVLEAEGSGVTTVPTSPKIATAMAPQPQVWWAAGPWAAPRTAPSGLSEHAPVTAPRKLLT